MTRDLVVEGNWLFEALLAEQCWQQPVVGQELGQEAADKIWELWCAAARKEIEALTEAEPQGIGEAYVFSVLLPSGEGAGCRRGGPVEARWLHFPPLGRPAALRTVLSHYCWEPL